MPNQPTRVLVTGAGGFIGHHLVTYLKQRGCWVRGVDLKYPEYTPIDADEFELRDLRRWDECLQATRGVDHVYALAADMGGMGFISANFAADLDEFSDLEIEGTASLRCPHLSHISGWFGSSRLRTPAVAAVSATRTGSHLGEAPSWRISGRLNSRSTSRASARCRRRSWR
jgi:hypothetical protein